MTVVVDDTDFTLHLGDAEGELHRA